MNMRSVYAKISMVKVMMIALLLGAVLQAKAFNAIESYQNQLQGQIKKGDTLGLMDEKFHNPLYDWQKLHNKTVSNIITFGIYHESKVVLSKAFTCEVDLKVEYWSSPEQADPCVDDHIKLKINYDPAAGVAYQDAATHRFMSGHRVRITINDITSAELGSSLPAAFRIISQVVVERSYDIDPQAVLRPVVSRQSGAAGVVARGTTIEPPHAVSLSWNKITGAEEYDVEWTFIDEESDNGRQLENAAGNISEIDLKRMFRNNASRVTVQKEQFDISLVHNAKYLLVRIRMVQNQDDGFRQEYPWQYQIEEAGETKIGVIDLSDNPWHQTNLNWQYNAVYVEDGKKKEIVNYFDGTLRNRQTVTVNNSDKTAIVQESIYDEFGRPLASILPAPVASPILKYYPGLHLVSATSEYTFNDVYGDAGKCINTPRPLSNEMGAARYYSPLNEFKDDEDRPENKYIPDAEGYPLAVTRYTGDNTGRVSMEGGVGKLFQPGPAETSKATRYFYGKPEQWELDRLFGNDVGYASHYLKNMAIDGNGQISISYQDASGRTIATALAGDKPDNVDGLSSKPDAVTKTIVVMNREFTFDESKMKISATATYMNAVQDDNAKLFVDIQQLVKKYAENGVNICSNCYYEGNILITDNCGNSTAKSVKIGSMAGSCDEEVFTTIEVPMKMDIGEYHINFELGIPEAAVTSYTRDFIDKNTNLKKEWEFVKKALTDKDFLACFNDCATCKESLGDLNTFNQRIKERLLADKVEVTANNGEITSWINNLYASLSSQCTALKANCANATPCSDLENAMKRDVSPGGQYALFDANGNPVEPSINRLKLHWREVFPIQPKESSAYIKEQFEQEDGTTTSPYDENFTLQMLMKYWKNDWAILFVPYHPEYCALEFCRDNEYSLRWDEQLRTMAKTIADIPANASGALYSETYIPWLVDNDPFFEVEGKGYGFRTDFINDLTNYSKNIAGGQKAGMPVKDLVGFVKYMLYCADYLGTTNVNNIRTREADNWTNCQPDEACRIRDREWTMYRDKYLELKDKYYQRVRNTSTYCGGECQVGTAASAYPVIDCPDASKFVLSRESGDVCAVPGAYSARLTYMGPLLSKPITVSIYYPDEYKSLKIGGGDISLPAGINSTAFCVNNQIPLSALRIAWTYCGTAAEDTFSCARHANADYFQRTTYGYDDATGTSKVQYMFVGPNPPVGKSITIKVGTDPNDPEVAVSFTVEHDRKGPFEVVEHGRINEWVLWITGCYDARPGTIAGCKIYSSKVSRITNVLYEVPPITTDTMALKAMVNDAMLKAINDNCEAQADAWIGSLSGLLGKLEYSGKVFQLKKKFIEICKLGGDAEHMYGATTLPAGKATAEGYKSFADAMKGIIPSQYNTMDYSPYLIDAPYPYDAKPQRVQAVLDATNVDICDRLIELTTEYNNAHTGGTLYAYLSQKYGAAMTITSAELDLLQKGCNNCRFLLEKRIQLPVFLEKGVKGCISATEYTQGVSDFTTIMGSNLDVNHANYERIFSNYFNSRFGFTLSYGDYKEYGDAIAQNPSAMLCNHPVYASVQQDRYECLMENIDDAVTVGHVSYSEYIEEIKRAFRADYIAYCGANKPKVSLTSQQQTYHYTLYYYDQAGNLVRTVPPEGVHPLEDELLFAQVDAVRRQGSASCTFTGPQVNTIKTTTLTQFSNAFDRTTNTAMEIWTYNQSADGGQLLATTTNRKYLFNICINGKYLTYDLHTITPVNTNEVDIVLSAHTTVDISAILPLTTWTHIVIQGDGLNKNNREIYVNGKACPRVNIASTGACTWELRSGSTGIVYPENISLLKQARFFSRKLTAQEIAANAGDACMGFNTAYATALESAKISWARMGIPAPGTGWTVDGGTTETQYVGVYPKHTLATSYAYQSLNGVQAQNSPDGGLSRFAYDMLGRVVVSQNAEQRDPQGRGEPSRISYTNYDEQGRVIEVGERRSAQFDAGPFLSATSLKTIDGYGKQHISKTYYDAPKIHTNNAIANAQTNLRKRVSAITYEDDGFGNAPEVTYYSYDQLGNVKTLWQQIKDLDIKQIDYKYDFVSGKVNKMRYQLGKADQFLYGYEYDAENRLTKAVSGINSVSKDGWAIETPHTDAVYRYYLHGSLSRIELGNEQLVQGIDYAYTLDGWLKGINGNYLSPADEMGLDGAQIVGNKRRDIARDAYAYTLSYFDGDYKPIGDETTTKALSLSWTAGDKNETGSDLFNGNISRSTIALKRVVEDSLIGYSYRYDQLNRLKATNQHMMPIGTTKWDAASIVEQFKEMVTYDGNGNILNYLRNGSKRRLYNMDQLNYVYTRDASGNLVHNRLSQVVDGVNNTNYTEDLKTQEANNYLYDNIGNLIKDKQGKILGIEWTPQGKIGKITKDDGSTLEYEYDGAGNRVYKKYTNGNTKDITWYIRDAKGNPLGVYGNKNNEDNGLKWKEQHLYGGNRLGIWSPDADITASASDVNWLKKGNKRYELSNHLGNVLVTISDKLVDSVIGNNVDHYEAEILSAQDYYPFGMMQPNRQWSLGSYRYGFNGKENDNEVKGEGNQQDYGFRIYDPRIGKFLSVDPLTKDYPWYTPYQFAGNSPIKAVDLDGLEPVSVGVNGNEIVYEGGFIVNNADIYRITFLNVILGLQLPRNLPSNPYDDQDPSNRSDWQKAYENVQFFFTHHTPAFSKSEAGTKTVQMLMVKQLFSGNNEDAEDAIRQIDKSEDFFYRYAFAESVTLFDGFVLAANNYVRGLFKVVSSKDFWVQKAINAIEAANPRSVRWVESIITDPRNGVIKTDFDIILDRHIVEVTGGKGGSKLDQIQNKIKLHTNKEVILYAPKIGKHAKLGLEEAGIKVFTNTDDLIKHINK